MGKIGPYGPRLAPRAWPVWDGSSRDAATTVGVNGVGDGRTDSNGSASPRPTPRLIVGKYGRT